MFDLPKIADDVLAGLLGAAVLWIFSTVWRLRRDVDAAFAKIRDIQRGCYAADELLKGEPPDGDQLA